MAGVIVADLTPDEGAPFEAVAAEAGIAVVYLVAPTTAPARRAEVAARSGGFLYCVSLVGVTGARTSLPPTVAKLVREVKAASPVPVAVGFGVSKPAHVRAIARAGADGVIVASALVDALGADGTDLAALAALVASLRARDGPLTPVDRLVAEGLVREAQAEAAVAAARGDAPFGAVLADATGHVVLRAANAQVTTTDRDGPRGDRASSGSQRATTASTASTG